MVVPLNRRGFLALIRNAAVATGLVAAAPINVLADSGDENPNGLPVLLLDNSTIQDSYKNGSKILNFKTLKHLAKNVTINSTMIKYGVIQYSILVWLPKNKARIDYDTYKGAKLCYGEMELLFRKDISCRYKETNDCREFSAICLKNTLNTILIAIDANPQRYLSY